MVILTWYNSLVLSGGSSVESSILTVEPSEGGVASLNPANEPAGPLGWGEAALNKGLLEFLGRSNM